MCRPFHTISPDFTRWISMENPKLVGQCIHSVLQIEGSNHSTQMWTSSHNHDCKNVRNGLEWPALKYDSADVSIFKNSIFLILFLDNSLFFLLFYYSFSYTDWFSCERPIDSTKFTIVSTQNKPVYLQNEKFFISIRTSLNCCWLLLQSEMSINHKEKWRENNEKKKFQKTEIFHCNFSNWCAKISVLLAYLINIISKNLLKKHTKENQKNGLNKREGQRQIS